MADVINMPPGDEHFLLPPPEHRQPQRARRRRRFWLWLLAGLMLLLLLWGIASRLWASHAVKRDTQANATPVVDVVTLEAKPAVGKTMLPGSVRAWHEAAIYPRVTGYIKAWYKDIGASVAAGDVLAEIETPETDADLRQAEADLQLAIANNKLAQATAKRYLDLLKTDSVTRQETDEKVADAAAKAASVQSSIAKSDRLRELEGFKRLVAPFDGIVSARNVDVGDLVNSGSAAPRELFHVATVERLRVYVSVPQNYLRLLNSGVTAQVRLAEHPGQSFPAQLIDTAGAIDPQTRTVQAQFALPNADGKLFPGGFAEVQLSADNEQAQQNPVVHLPVGALIFRAEGAQAATVDEQNRVHLQKITIGRDFGSEVEVVAGLQPGDRVIKTPPDSLYDGETVRIGQPPQPNGGSQQQEGKQVQQSQDQDKDSDEKKSGDKSQKKTPDGGYRGQQQDDKQSGGQDSKKGDDQSQQKPASSKDASQ